MERRQAAVHDEIRRRDATFYRELEEAGFLIGHGEDGTGFVPQLFRRGSGYYVDIGASGLIANGSIKVRSRVAVEAIKRTAGLAGCSESQVKRIWAIHLNQVAGDSACRAVPCSKLINGPPLSTCQQTKKA
jgi:hypothetical protein